MTLVAVLSSPTSTEIRVVGSRFLMSASTSGELAIWLFFGVVIFPDDDDIKGDFLDFRKILK